MEINDKLEICLMPVSCTLSTEEVFIFELPLRLCPLYYGLYVARDGALYRQIGKINGKPAVDFLGYYKSDPLDLNGRDEIAYKMLTSSFQ